MHLNGVRCVRIVTLQSGDAPTEALRALRQVLSLADGAVTPAIDAGAVPLLLVRVYVCVCV